MFKIVAAIGQNRELGKNNDLCFHLKADMKFFRQTTMGHAVLMGYKTWQSLPGALPGRSNYVLSRSPRPNLPEPDNLDANPTNTAQPHHTLVQRVPDLDKFIDVWYNRRLACFVIGGGSIYRQLLPYAEELILTEIAASCPSADVFFPAFDPAQYDKIELDRGEENGTKYRFVQYKRKSSLYVTQEET